MEIKNVTLLLSLERPILRLDAEDVDEIEKLNKDE